MHMVNMRLYADYGRDSPTRHGMGRRALHETAWPTCLGTPDLHCISTVVTRLWWQGVEWAGTEVRGKLESEQAQVDLIWIPVASQPGGAMSSAAGQTQVDTPFSILQLHVPTQVTQHALHITWHDAMVQRDAQRWSKGPRSPCTAFLRLGMMRPFEQLIRSRDPLTSRTACCPACPRDLAAYDPHACRP